MVDPDETARLHDAENREGFAVRKLEEAMAADEREMEAELRRFEEHEAQTKRRIFEEWRQEHWGKDPERPPDWATDPAGPMSRPRRSGGSPGPAPPRCGGAGAEALPVRLRRAAGAPVRLRRAAGVELAPKSPRSL